MKRRKKKPMGAFSARIQREMEEGSLGRNADVVGFSFVKPPLTKKAKKKKPPK